MDEIRTHVDIDAPAAIVWSILADFGAYGVWNPLIRGVLGKPDEGRTIEIRLRNGRHADSRTRPRIVRLLENREMHWLTRGLVSSERRFRIEHRLNGVRFHHSQKLSGLLRAFSPGGASAPKQKDMEDMNRALKVRAERACRNDEAR